MIAEAAIFLKEELSKYLLIAGVIQQKDDVHLGNISGFSDYNLKTGKVIISLVNIEEESPLKNAEIPLNKSVAPPLNLNLYFLFTATQPKSEVNINRDYQEALRRIDTVIRFFQNKIIFTMPDPAGISRTKNVGKLKSTEIRLVSELVTLTFEQMYHLWGALGAKQSPFVLYKVRVLKIQN